MIAIFVNGYTLVLIAGAAFGLGVLVGAALAVGLHRSS